MIARLRRHRWLFTLLLAASPAFAGQLLPLLHPCPIDSPWLAGAHATMPGMAHGASHGAQHDPAHHDCCTCIGCCATPAVTTPPQSIVVPVAVEAPRHATWPLIAATNHLPNFIERLPEKTAPPLA